MSVGKRLGKAGQPSKQVLGRSAVAELAALAGRDDGLQPVVDALDTWCEAFDEAAAALRYAAQEPGVFGTAADMTSDQALGDSTRAAQNLDRLTMLRSALARASDARERARDAYSRLPSGAVPAGLKAAVVAGRGGWDPRMGVVDSPADLSALEVIVEAERESAARAALVSLRGDLGDTARVIEADPVDARKVNVFPDHPRFSVEGDRVGWAEPVGRSRPRVELPPSPSIDPHAVPGVDPGLGDDPTDHGGNDGTGSGGTPSGPPWYAPHPAPPEPPRSTEPAPSPPRVHWEDPTVPTPWSGGKQSDPGGPGKPVAPTPSVDSTGGVHGSPMSWGYGAGMAGAAALGARAVGGGAGLGGSGIWSNGAPGGGGTMAARLGGTPVSGPLSASAGTASATATPGASVTGAGSAIGGASARAGGSAGTGGSTGAGGSRPGMIGGMGAGASGGSGEKKRPGSLGYVAPRIEDEDPLRRPARVPGMEAGSRAELARIAAERAKLRPPRHSDGSTLQ